MASSGVQFNGVSMAGQAIGAKQASQPLRTESPREGREGTLAHALTEVQFAISSCHDSLNILSAGLSPVLVQRDSINAPPSERPCPSGSPMSERVYDLHQQAVSLLLRINALHQSLGIE